MIALHNAGNVTLNNVTAWIGCLSAFECRPGVSAPAHGPAGKVKVSH